jgi:uncharacterized membrane protein YgcG
MLIGNSTSLMGAMLLLMLVAAYLSAVGAAANSAGLRPADIPSPMDYPGTCHRESVSNSAICDIDDMLSKGSKDVIEGIMNEIASKKHGEAAACIIYKMAPSFISQSGGTIEKAGDAFAHQVFDNWGVGDKDKQDGVLLFVSIMDRMVYISTGKGVDALFPSQVTDGIVEHMRPYLRDNNFGRAMEAGVTEIGLILSKEAIPQAFWSVKHRGSVEPVEFTWQSVLWILGILSTIGYCVYAGTKAEREQRERMRSGQAALNRLLRDVGSGQGTGTGTGSGAAGSNGGDRFHADSCPICLEDFTPSNADNQDASATTDTNIGGAPTSAAVSADPTPSNSEITPLNTSSPTPSPRRAVMLQCEHQFCFDCISAYLKTPEGNKCPICRAPVDTGYGTSTSANGRTQHRPDAGLGADAGAGAGIGADMATSFFGEAGGGSSCSFRAGRLRTRTSWTHRQAEMMYRLGRMRTLYPEVMPADTMATLSAAVQSDAATFTAAIQARATQVSTMITNADRRAAMRSSGSSGSSKPRFGGGRSSRGGGGRW